MLKQRTLRNSIKAVGIGLHAGKNINMELIPSDVNTGINLLEQILIKSLLFQQLLKMLVTQVYLQLWLKIM